MIIFWLIFSLMTLIAMSFLITPFFRQSAQTAVATNNTGKNTIYLLLLLLPVLAITLYLKLGASEKMAEQQNLLEKSTLINAEIKKLGSLQNIILKLKEQIAENPDAEGWSLLGRLYLKSQQFKDAAHAFAQANQLTPNQLAILIPFAESLYFANNQVLTPQAKQLLSQALRQQPNQPDALNLLAMHAYQTKAYLDAIHYWEQLLPQLPTESAEQKQLLQLIAKAQQKAKPASRIQLPVSVTLSKAFQSRITGDETLFVYAKAVNGPPMPLAIVRKQVRDLPLKVTLDDSTAMISDVNLSAYKQVKITARISKSGQAMPVKGDLIGSSVIIDVAHPPDRIAVLIDQEQIN